MAAKNFLGGIFKKPSFKSFKEIVRGKLGYLPKDDSDITKEYFTDPVTRPPYVPKIFPFIYFH